MSDLGGPSPGKPRVGLKCHPQKNGLPMNHRTALEPKWDDEPTWHEPAGCPLGRPRPICSDPWSYSAGLPWLTWPGIPPRRVGGRPARHQQAGVPCNKKPVGLLCRDLAGRRPIRPGNAGTPSADGPWRTRRRPNSAHPTHRWQALGPSSRHHPRGSKTMGRTTRVSWTGPWEAPHFA